MGKGRVDFLSPRLRDVCDLLPDIDSSLDGEQWRINYPGMIPVAITRLETSSEDQAGPFFVMDTHDPACPILWCDENAQLEKHYRSLDEFLDDIRWKTLKSR